MERDVREEPTAGRTVAPTERLPLVWECVCAIGCVVFTFSSTGCVVFERSPDVSFSSAHRMCRFRALTGCNILKLNGHTGRRALSQFRSPGVVRFARCIKTKEGGQWTAIVVRHRSRVENYNCIGANTWE